MTEDTSDLTDRIADFRTWGFDARGWSQATRYAYGRRVKYADAWLIQHHDTTVVDADVDDVRAWLASLPANARTRNHSRCAVNAWYAYLIARGLRTDNPVAGIDPLRVPRLIPKAHTTGEAHRIWQAAKADEPKWTAAFALFLFAGLRISEARYLEWSDIQDGYVRFTAKGGDERVVPLHPEADEALEAWRNECESLRWVFPGRDPSRPMSGGWLYKNVRRIAEEQADVTKSHPHKLRHTFATEMVEAGADIRAVQEMLGHSSLEITQVYTKVRPSRLRDAVGRLGFGAAS